MKLQKKIWILISLFLILSIFPSWFPIKNITNQLDDLDNLTIQSDVLQNYTMTIDYPYTWINASDGIDLSLGDEDYSTQYLPFNFAFYNETFSTVNVSSNGVLSFSDTPPPFGMYANDLLPSPDSDNWYLIAPFWDDLNPSQGGNVYVKNFSTYWVVEWSDISHFGGTLQGNFEAILFQNGPIIFNYDYISYHDGYTCGLNLGLDTSYYSSYQNLNTSVDDFSILFSYGPNNPPSLSLPSVTPATGNQTTLFNFTVIYTDFDNHKPVYVNVSINGVNHKMSKQNSFDNDYTDGCVYQFSSYFIPDTYQYSFSCSDGELYDSTSVQYLAVLYSSQIAPILSDGQVSPSIGYNSTTIFKFSVNYTDTENNAPEYVDITINSTTYSMYKQDSLDNNYTDGCWYDFETTLDEIGDYTHIFNCSDGIFTDGDGPYIGPTVVEICRNYTMVVDYPYNWVNVSDGISLALTDNGYSTQDLPFNFTFYNDTFSAVHVSANGYLSFTDDTPSTFLNPDLPQTGSSDYEYIIAPFWGPLHLPPYGYVYIKNFSTYWVVEWYNISYSAPDFPYIGNFEVILYNTGEILFSYELIESTWRYTCGLNFGFEFEFDPSIEYYSEYRGIVAPPPFGNFSIFFTPYPPKNPSIIINNGAATTSSSLVTLTLSASLALEMRFRNEPTGEWTDWEPYTTTKQVYLAGTIPNTVYSIYVEFQNEGGKTDPVYDSITYIVPVPSNPSIIINNGDNSTDSPLVTLSLSADGAQEMCFRNGTDGTWTAWESYSTTKQINVAGSTNNTIYSISAKFRNLGGESEVVSDDILFLTEGDGDDGDGDDGDGDGGRRIPGYPLYLLLTFFIVITAIIIKKKCKKLP